MGRLLTILPLLAACNTDPGDPAEQVGYRDGDTGVQSAERGNIQISEVFWSGSVTDDGTWDQTDIFVEFRNEGTRPQNLSNFFLELTGSVQTTFRLPAGLPPIEVGDHQFLAAKSDGCFPEPAGIIEDFAIPFGDPFKLTLLDADERLINDAGSDEQPPYGGGYDYVDSRSMERVELMFGARGSQPFAWHFYTEAEVDVPNNTNIAEGCREHTLASPGLANSPDYSGAYASGGFE